MATWIKGESVVLVMLTFNKRTPLVKGCKVSEVPGIAHKAFEDALREGFALTMEVDPFICIMAEPVKKGTRKN